MVSPPQSGPGTGATIQARGLGRASRASAPTLPPTPTPLERLQDSLPGRLRQIPVQALLAAGGLAVIGAVVVASVLVRNNKAIEALEADGAPVAAVTPAAPRASSAMAVPKPIHPTGPQLDAARLGGADTLAALAQQYPEDSQLLEALCAAEVREKKDYATALRVLSHLLDVAPDKKRDAEVREVLIDIANGPPEVASEAFEIMKTKMGTEGPDILYDLLQLSNGKYAKEHVASALTDPETMKSASKALLIADELRRALPCSRKALLGRAAAEGDGRSVPSLRQMVATNCRAFFRGAECYQCFTPQDRAAITAAIEAIEKREKR